MPPVIRQQRRARREILESFAYLEERSGLEVAERFLLAVLDTFQELAASPKVGRPCGFERPALRKLRNWPVKGFENWRILYLPRRDGVEVVHVIHGARDVETLLGER